MLNTYNYNCTNLLKFTSHNLNKCQTSWHVNNVGGWHNSFLCYLDRQVQKNFNCASPNRLKSKVRNGKRLLNLLTARGSPVVQSALVRMQGARHHFSVHRSIHDPVTCHLFERAKFKFRVTFTGYRAHCHTSSVVTKIHRQKNMNVRDIRGIFLFSSVLFTRTPALARLTKISLVLTIIVRKSSD